MKLLELLNDYKHTKTAAALFFHAHVVCITKMVTSEGEVRYELIDSLPHQEDINKPASGLRITCKDAHTLQACIKWYASAKFEPHDHEYIDSNEWDEDNCDFAPRVFQSFVWGDCEKSDGEGDGEGEHDAIEIIGSDEEEKSSGEEGGSSVLRFGREENDKVNEGY